MPQKLLQKSKVNRRRAILVVTLLLLLTAGSSIMHGLRFHEEDNFFFKVILVLFIQLAVCGYLIYLFVKSEKKYESNLRFVNILINNNIDYTLLIDHTYKIILFNEKTVDLFNKLWGVSLVRGLVLTDLITGIEKKRLISDFENARQRKTILTRRQIKNQEGDSLTFKISYTTVDELTHGFNGMVIAMADITEEQNAKAQIQQSQLKLHLIFANTPTGILMMDENRNIIDCNKSATEMLKYQKQDLLKLNARDIVYDNAAYLELTTKLNEQGKMQANTTLKTSDDLSVYVNIMALKFTDPITGKMTICSMLTNLEEYNKRERVLTDTGKLAKVGWWEVDLVNNTVFWSPITKAIHGVSESYIPNLQEAIGFYKDDETREIVTNHLQKSIATGESFDFELELKTLQGEIKWVRSIGRVEFINRQPIRIFGVFQDINDKRVIDTELQRKEVKIQALFDQNPDAVAAVDMDGVITHANNAFLSMSELPMHLVAGRHFADFIHEESLATVSNLFQNTLSGQPNSIDVMSSDIDPGKRYMLNIIGIPIIVNKKVEGVYAVIKNITQHKQTEDKIKMLSFVAEYTNSIVIILNGRQKVLWANNAFAQQTGYALTDFEGHESIDFLYGLETSEETRRYNKKMMDAGVSFSSEILIYTKEGEKHWMAMQCHPVYNHPKTLVDYYVIIKEDITAIKQLISKLEGSEDKFKGLFHNNPSCIIIWDPVSFGILAVNNTAAELYGYSQEAFCKLKFLDLQVKVPVSQTTQDSSNLQKQVKDNKTVLIEKHQTASGSVITLQIISHVTAFNGKTVVLTIATDITKQTELQEKIEQVRISQENEITASVLLAQDKEREFIGQELHDNINQLLISGRLFMDLYVKEQQVMHPYIAKADAILETAITEIRNLSHNLVSPFSKIQSLREIVEQLVAIVAKLGSLEIEMQLNLLDDYFEEVEEKKAIYRIIQEQLSNILKHAKATQVLIHFSINKRQRVMIIKDNGIGFNSAEPLKGVGLKNIAARCKVQNWQFALLSSPGTGCLVQIKMPI